mgnify:CR=1 FL=1|jgi:hypothetical protein|tara:strand:- start:208 stop:453 length:246 start_codon:yes stop_codon:yes gene_type:complete
MNVTNEKQEDTPLLTQGDLAIAAYSISEVFNSYLERYEEEDYGELTKEQMEASMNNLRLAFTKFDSLIKTIVEREQINEGG